MALRPAPPTRLQRGLYAVARWTAGTLVILYGFAKIMGAQFTVLDSVLDTPLGEVSGFWLTWYYFAFSPAYGTIIAVIQVVAGLLLLVSRTALLGASAVLAIMANIVLVNAFFGIGGGAFASALLITGCALYVLWQHRAALLDVFVRAPDPFAARARSRVRTAVGIGARVGVLIAAAALMYWVANFNNRAPTPIDGTWEVTSGPEADTVERVYFERNRAFMAVFAYPDGTRTHHFDVTDAAPRGQVTVWETWLSKGDTLLTGEYDAARGTMTLRAPELSEPYVLSRTRPAGG